MRGDLNNNPYGFTGQRFEPELRMYSFAYRTYNPMSMRWMTPDPVRDGTNWYQYVSGDPVNLWDPLGLWIDESYNKSYNRWAGTDIDNLDDNFSVPGFPRNNKQAYNEEYVSFQYQGVEEKHFYVDKKTDNIFGVPVGVGIETGTIQLKNQKKENLVKTSLVGAEAYMGVNKNNMSLSAKGEVYMYKVKGGLKIAETDKHIVYLTGEVSAGGVGGEVTLGLKESKLKASLAVGIGVGYTIYEK